MAEVKEVILDENLDSRNIMTLDKETMKKLKRLKVFIYGLRGLGIEVAKNIILYGCEEVSIYDPNLVKINDLGSNFYLTEEDIGKKRRDEACIDKLSKLNSHIKTSILDIEQKKDIKNIFNIFVKK